MSALLSVVTSPGEKMRSPNQPQPIATETPSIQPPVPLPLTMYRLWLDSLRYTTSGLPSPEKSPGENRIGPSPQKDPICVGWLDVRPPRPSPLNRYRCVLSRLRASTSANVSPSKSPGENTVS